MRKFFLGIFLILISSFAFFEGVFASSYTYTNDKGDTLRIDTQQSFLLYPTLYWPWISSDYISENNQNAIVYQKNNGGRYVIFIIEWRGGSPEYIVWDTYTNTKYFLLNAGGFFQKDISSDKINIVPFWNPGKSFILDIDDPFNLQVQDVPYPDEGQYISDGFNSFISSEPALAWGGWNEVVPKSLPTPTNLSQFIEMPDPKNSEKDQNYKLAREPIGVNTELGYKIGHFQSGSGIILTASVDTGGESGYSVFAEVFASGSTTPFFTDEKSVDSNTGSGEILVPITSLPAGEYRWTMRVKKDGRESEVVEYGTNPSNETDFAIFDGFEPYPYGYKFENNSPISSILTGGIDYWSTTFPFYNPTKIDGSKWDIFESAFDTTNYIGNIRKKYDAFESLGLNGTNPSIFQGGNCFGMASSALMASQYPQYINSYYSDFGTQSIWSRQSPLIDSSLKWSEYDSTVKTILAFQLKKYSDVIIKSGNKGYVTPKELLDILKINPDKLYILNFWGDGGGHTVVPYKVEGNRVYIWDNNIQYPKRMLKNLDVKYGYKQYIDIVSENDWSIELYKSYFNWTKFYQLNLIDIQDVFNLNQKSFVYGFNGQDIVYTLSGASNIYLTDSIGNISGFKNGQVFEQILGVQPILPLNANLNGIPDNTFKQIYLPQKMDGLTLHIEGTTNEKYTLMIAGGDYYQKLEGVPTTPGQTDTFETTGTGLTINFDDSKTGTYSLLVDNFHDYGTTNTGTVYIDSTDILTQIQQYSIDWTKVTQNTPDALNYQIDTNNDGTYDTGTTLPSIYHEGTEKKIYTLLHPQISQTQNSGGGGWGGGSAKQRGNTQQGVKNVEVYQSVHTTQTGTLTPKPQISNNSQPSQTSKPGQVSKTTLLKKGGKILYSTRFYKEDEKQMIQKNKQKQN